MPCAGRVRLNPVGKLSVSRQPQKVLHGNRSRPEPDFVCRAALHFSAANFDSRSFLGEQNLLNAARNHLTLQWLGKIYCFGSLPTEILVRNQLRKIGTSRWSPGQIVSGKLLGKQQRMEPKQGMKVPVKHPEELLPVVKRQSRSPLAIAGGGRVNNKPMADGQKLYGKLLAPDRDILSDHGIWRLINGGNAAAAEWLIANVVDEDTRGLESVKTERGHK